MKSDNKIQGYFASHDGIQSFVKKTRNPRNSSHSLITGKNQEKAYTCSMDPIYMKTHFSTDKDIANYKH